MKKLILNISLTLISGWVVAQDAHLIIGTSAQLTNDAIIVVNGSLENQGQIDNGDTFIITKDFIAEGPYAGSGTLRLDGPLAAEIVCLDTINHFVVSKPGSQITSADNLIIRSSFDLVSGIVDLDGNALRLGTSVLAPLVQGGDENDFVRSGSITAYFPAPAEVKFPVGDLWGTPISFDVIDISGTASELTVQMGAFAHPQMPASPDYVDAHWLITASGISTIDYNLEAEYHESQVVGDENLIAPHYIDSGIWTGAIGGGADLEEGNYFTDTVNNVVSWGLLTDLGSTGLFGWPVACAGDFNMDGVINTSDLLLLLGGFGCSVACPQDLTGDGLTNTSDLLAFLGLFGSLCP